MRGGSVLEKCVETVKTQTTQFVWLTAFGSYGGKIHFSQIKNDPRDSFVYGFYYKWCQSRWLYSWHFQLRQTMFSQHFIYSVRSLVYLSVCLSVMLLIILCHVVVCPYFPTINKNLYFYHTECIILNNQNLLAWST